MLFFARENGQNQTIAQQFLSHQMASLAVSLTRRFICRAMISQERSK